MIDVVVKCGHMKTGRIFFSVPRIGESLRITFAEDGVSRKVKVVEVSYQELRVPDENGNSGVPFATWIDVEDIL